ncbi:hypothetical protein ACEPPU_23980 [Priestia aryabhattai]|uniref:hypothetical protein n=1 Tax=Priestia aryabhattai TaxID=412384 RepID=UPI0035ABF810
MKAPVEQVMEVVKNQPYTRTFEIDGEEYKLIQILTPNRCYYAVELEYIFRQGEKHYRMLASVELTDKWNLSSYNFDTFKSDFELEEVKLVTEKIEREYWEVI